MEGGQVVDWASLEVLGEQRVGGCVWPWRCDGLGPMAGCGDHAVKFFDFSVRNAYTHSSI